MDYRQSGVDIEAGYRAVKLMKADVERTKRPEVLSSLGSFAGAFSLAKIRDMKEPVLLSGTDGVGTKLKLAFETGIHDTIGTDCVAMCVNDIAAQGAEPLFFLDYIACGKNIPEKIAAIVKGIADGCVQAGCALIGGETAEHPGMMPEEEYDLAGFAVGVCEQEELIDGHGIEAGDVLVALSSSGVHSNGFSLVRSVLREAGIGPDACDDALGGNIYRALLTPTRIYVGALGALKKAGIRVRGCSHITGGGFYENIPRMLPEGMLAQVRRDAYEVPYVFRFLQEKGGMTDEDMYGTFNMGIGMMLALRKEDGARALEVLREAGENAFVCGEIVSGEKGVTIC